MPSKRPSLKINAISNWASLAVQVAVGFFLTPFVISHLGQSGYGIWVLVGSFIGYYGLLNLGVGSAITRYIARYSARDDSKSLNEIANTALLMFCITGIMAIVLSILIAEPLSRYFHITPEHFKEFKHIVIVLGVATGLSFPSGVLAAMITARERYIVVNIINISATLIRTGLTVVVLLKGYGLAGIAYPALIATVVSLVAFSFLAKVVVPEFKLQTSFAKFSTLKMLLIYGGFTTIIAVADILRLQIDSIVIGKMIGITEVGIYGIAALLIRYILRFVVAGMGVLSPRFASLDSANKTDELKETFLRALSISSFIACGASLIVLLFGRSFIYLWVGREFTSAVPVLTILAIAYAFALSQTPGISLMYSLNKHRYYAIVTMVEAIANVLLSILLAHKYGIIGVAMGTAIPMVIVKVFIQPLYVSRITGICLSDYFKAIAPAFTVSLTIGVVMCFVMVLGDYAGVAIKSYVMLAVSVCLVGSVYYFFNVLISPTIRRITFSFLPRYASIKALLLP